MEIWKDVKEYEGLYQVSNLGRVKSLPKMAGRRPQPEKLSSTFADKHGYIKVNLYKQKNHKQYYVHRLVADAFILNENELPQINHIDGNKSNNTVENLEWCTARSNIKHAYSMGLMSGRKGSKHHMFGKKHSLETRKKLSIAATNYWNNRKSMNCGEIQCGL